MLQNKKLIIFDCDGVLFHSDRANVEYFNSVMELAGALPYPDHLKEKIGYQSISQLLNEAVHDQHEADRLIAFSQTVDFDPFLGMLTPRFDFDAVLGELRKQFFLAVASNRGNSLTRIFHHFDLFRFFHYKISVNEARPKPDPDMLLKTMGYFDTPPAATLFLGDAVTDLQSAKSAGIDFIWVGEQCEEPCISSVEELLKA